ncbi:MAG: tRNA 2-thiouridine(34) synthase MnmA [Candidatus Moranbacteria bacterium]|nr:tRNA 2-thiouridine(34) synthase MnmA [Candidatus Moranbacteria bacterium]
MKNKPKKVIVGMSGGVDSTVAAAILKKQGYKVVGVFLHFWKEPKKDTKFEKKCCSLEAYEDLKKICKIIGIKLIVINAEKEFKKEVVDYFLREYKNGRTPNPCVVCNREIKFKIMFKKMLELETDFVASGHYARLRRKISNPKSQIPNSAKGGSADGGKSKILYKLITAKDKNKNQSYFLYTLNQKQLAKILFPLGEYKKPEIRKLAQKIKLPVFDKPESQDVCFISSNVENFLKKYLKLKKGKIIDEAGNILGNHQGLPLYTIGQRKGLNIGGSGPFFVTAKNFRRNRLIVTNNQKAPELFSEEILVEKVNWIVGAPKFPAKILLRTRYRNPLVSAIIKAENTEHITHNKIYKIIFSEPQRAIAPGQSAVFYGKKGEVLGGGVIN